MRQGQSHSTLLLCTASHVFIIQSDTLILCLGGELILKQEQAILVLGHIHLLNVLIKKDDILCSMGFIKGTHQSGLWLCYFHLWVSLKLFRGRAMFSGPCPLLKPNFQQSSPFATLLTIGEHEQLPPISFLGEVGN